MVAKNRRSGNLKADVVIIGAGAAGLAAAVTAREAGAKDVIVLESRHIPGGNASASGGVFGVETPLQRLHGLNISRDEIFTRFMDYTHWKTDAQLVRALVDISGDNIRWLETMGIKFVKLVPLHTNQILLAYHATQERTGPVVIKTLVKRCEEVGVRILCETAAKKLLVGKGNVNGVFAEANGKESRIETRTVIVSTGGFSGNKELLKKYLPGWDEKAVHLRGLPHNGDGMLMAAEIGAAIGGTFTPEAEGPSFIGSSGHVDLISRLPYAIWVNRRGERFMDEGSTSVNETANAIFEQPGKTTYAIFDEGIKNMVLKEDFNPFLLRRMDKDAFRTGLDGALKSQAKEGKIKITDSWREMAKWIGADSQVLENTLDQYNTACDRGHDSLLVKDRRYLVPLRTPPYYAVPCQVVLLVTHGGIKVNHHLQVLDLENNPIRGLYSAGDDTSGQMGDTYSIRFSGISMCFALGSGRIAGRSAARYAMEK
ncbi:MAG: FAD-dependent oxidoreductase [Chloroflexota bacterium]